MYNSPTPLQNFWQNTTPTQKIAISFLPLAFIAIIIITIIALTSRPSTAFDDTDAYHINITNFSITGGATDYQLALQKYLWIILQASNLPYDTEVSAEIREDSLTQTEDNTTVGSSFLVDIPALRQTFAIEYTWPKGSTRIDTSLEDQYAIAASCPTPSEVIYEGEICRLSADPYDTINQYLPFHGYSQNLTISIEKERYADTSTEEGTTVDNLSADEVIPPAYAGKNFLWVTLNTCDDPTLLTEGKAYLADWLTARLADPNDFLVEYYEYCDD